MSINKLWRYFTPEMTVQKHEKGVFLLGYVCVCVSSITVLFFYMVKLFVYFLVKGSLECFGTY